MATSTQPIELALNNVIDPVQRLQAYATAAVAPSLRATGESPAYGTLEWKLDGLQQAKSILEEHIAAGETIDPDSVEQPFIHFYWNGAQYALTLLGMIDECGVAWEEAGTEWTPEEMQVILARVNLMISDINESLNPPSGGDDSGNIQIGGAIVVETIRTNPYAPESANAVNMYHVNGSEKLSLAQMVAAVCFHRAAVLEQRSVLQMNQLHSNTKLLSSMGVVLKMVANDSAYSTTLTSATIPVLQEGREITLWGFLVNICGIDNSSLPSRLNNASDRIACCDVIRRRMDNFNTQSQQQTIDLQSTVNWRDVTFNMSSGILARNGTTGMNMAGNIINQ